MFPTSRVSSRLSLFFGNVFLVLLSSFYLKYIFLLKYILGNTFWEIHFEKHIVRVDCAEIQHCYFREAKTFEQTTLGKKHLAKRNVFHYLPCMMRIQSGIRIKQGRFTSGGLKTQQKAIAACCSFILKHIYCIYILDFRASLRKLVFDTCCMRQKTTLVGRSARIPPVTMSPGYYSSNCCNIYRTSYAWSDACQALAVLSIGKSWVGGGIL